MMKTMALLHRKWISMLSMMSAVPKTGDEGVTSAVILACVGGGLVILFILLTIWQKKRKKNDDTQ